MIRLRTIDSFNGTPVATTSPTPSAKYKYGTIGDEDCDISPRDAGLTAERVTEIVVEYNDGSFSCVFQMVEDYIIGAQQNISLAKGHVVCKKGLCYSLDQQYIQTTVLVSLYYFPM